MDGDVRARPPPDVAGRLLVRVEAGRQDVARCQLVLASARRGDGEGEWTEAHGEIAIGAADQAAGPEAPAGRDDGDRGGLEGGMGVAGWVHGA